MKPEKIREMSIDDMTAKVAELRTELLKLRFQSATSQLKNLLKKKWVKKDIARVLTIIKEKQNAK